MSSNRTELNHFPMKDKQIKLLSIASSVDDGDWNSIPHSHYFSELFYVTSGTGKVVVEDESIQVSEDDIVLINPKVLHTEISSGSFSYLVLGIEGLAFLFDEESGNGKYSVYHFQSYQKEFRFYFQILAREIESKPVKYELICQNILEIVLINMVRYSDFHFSIVPASKAGIETATIKRYLDSHFKEAVTLDLLAQTIHMNKFYLSHSFKDAYGVSPIQYLINRRIAESRALLESTDYSLSQISQIIGFSSSSYFTQIFKKATGQTPKEYRILAKKKLSGDTDSN